nr:hypothetical protein [Prochlorococcus marinus]
MPIINIRQFNIKSFKKNFSLHILFKRKFSFEIFFTVLIILGIPLNLYKNRFYDNSWTVGEWLISYAGGFVRRGLPGELIHFISTHYSLSPILLVWIFSVLSLVCLILLILYFCKNSFEKSFLLSQLIILAPISEDFLVRKDTLIVFLYGLCLLMLKFLCKKSIGRITCFLGINLFSIIATLSHESYGIWALPSLIFILYLYERSNKTNRIKSFFLALFNLIPALLSFLLCWVFKGDINQSQSIHQSWQALSHILPSTGSLKALEPSGAIAAIGYESSRVYSNTLISQFNLLVFWHPGMWLLTIFLTIRLFIGINKKPNQDAKRFVLCYQLIAFLPMFLFVDIGRWIFMWLSSSALLFSFLKNFFGINLIIQNALRLKGSRFLPKLIPGFNSLNNYNTFLLFLGIPHCCWSLGRYLISNPIGFSIKNLIFYFKLFFIK